jgi:hypothetical protein
LEAVTDVMALARDADFGDLQLVDGQLCDVDGTPPDDQPSALVLLRNVRGEVDAAVVDVGTAEALLALGEGARLDLPEGEVEALRELGVVVPARWRG